MQPSSHLSVRSDKLQFLVTLHWIKWVWRMAGCKWHVLEESRRNVVTFLFMGKKNGSTERQRCQTDQIEKHILWACDRIVALVLVKMWNTPQYKVLKCQIPDWFVRCPILCPSSLKSYSLGFSSSNAYLWRMDRPIFLCHPPLLPFIWKNNK